MITLYTFPEAFGLRNVSPFCLKVEMTLAHLGLAHEIAMESDPRKAPKGRLPYIVVEGRQIADSELILEHLDRLSHGGLYGTLSGQEYGAGMAYTRLAEDHLYWLLVAARWLDDDWFANVKAGFFSYLPPVVRSVASYLARKQVRQTLHLHGLGRHSPEEQRDFARRDLRALDGALATQDYLVGDRLTVFDFNVASLLAGIFDNRPAHWLTDIAAEFPRLREYAERVQGATGVFARSL